MSTLEVILAILLGAFVTTTILTGIVVYKMFGVLEAIWKGWK